MARSLITFDIETARSLPRNANLKRYMPLPISVAATVVPGGEERIWLSNSGDGTPATVMTTKTASDLLDYLWGKHRDGHTVCGWNCIGFDLYCLAAAADAYELAAHLSRVVCDPMYQFFTLNGFPVGLERVAKGFGLKYRKEVDSAKIPDLWKRGEYDQVKAHVLNDCRMTNSVIQAIADAGCVRWITAKGTPTERELPKLLPGGDVMALRRPDQSWMDQPIPKWSFTYWIPKKQLPKNAIGCTKPVSVFDIAELPVSFVEWFVRTLFRWVRSHPRESLLISVVLAVAAGMAVVISSFDSKETTSALAVASGVTIGLMVITAAFWWCFNKSNKPAK